MVSLKIFLPSPKKKWMSPSWRTLRVVATLMETFAKASRSRNFARSWHRQVTMCQKPLFCWKLSAMASMNASWCHPSSWTTRTPFIQHRPSTWSMSSQSCWVGPSGRARRLIRSAILSSLWSSGGRSAHKCDSDCSLWRKLKEVLVFRMTIASLYKLFFWCKRPKQSESARQVKVKSCCTWPSCQLKTNEYTKKNSKRKPKQTIDPYKNQNFRMTWMQNSNTI